MKKRFSKAGLARHIVSLAAIAMVLVLAACSGTPTTTGGTKGNLPNNGGIAAFDHVQTYTNEKGLTVKDFLKGDILIRREIHHQYIIEVFTADADGKKLVRTGTITNSPPSADEKVDYKEYKDDQGRLVTEVQVNGFLFTRQVSDPATRVVRFAIYNKDRDLLEQIEFGEEEPAGGETKPAA
jgi:hypothetical protein